MQLGLQRFHFGLGLGLHTFGRGALLLFDIRERLPQLFLDGPHILRARPCVYAKSANLRYCYSRTR